MNVDMQTLLILSLGLASVGGATALGALFHYFAQIRKASALESERSRDDVFDELDRRERSFEEYCARLNCELEEKRRALEALTAQATEAATALSGALDSVSFALGSADVPATPFELRELADVATPVRAR